ncbi:hypothetical protein [Paenibacillus sp.]|uniref:hypothetical protein n=1 Tax=Paenibacillus sp. TaxID=58172 RepID=UPI002D53FA8E|nr:hypothetical protein [Paenibacillus sp.]HZG88496.1 hypothetical protein [Paenibacillus sp.]
MISKQQWTQLRGALRRPKVALLLVALLGAAPSIAILIEAYAPAVQAQLQTAAEAERLRAQRAELTATPIPAPFRPEDMGSWLAKVPVENNHAALLQMLLAIEAESGGRINSFTVEDEETEPGNVLDALAAAQASQQQQTEDVQEASASPSPDQAAGAVPSDRLVSEMATVEVSGSYAQVMGFWERLTRAERIVVVRDWELTTAAASAPAGEDGSGVVGLRISFYTYTAPAFADLAEAAVPPRAEGAPKREDPTLSNERFYEQLAESQEGE